MTEILITKAQLVNEGKIYTADVLIKGDRIYKIGQNIVAPGAMIVDGKNQYLLPGCIDDQVHFREPGLTHKATIATESRAAVAGGVTSYMEMPNTNPPTLTQDLLADKYQIAAETSLANYSFFMGASNDNIEEVKRTDPGTVCGIKVFMGSSTGSMLVDDDAALEALFANAHLPIATHCEDETTIRRNLEIFRERYGDDIPFSCHPEIRSAEALVLQRPFHWQKNTVPGCIFFTFQREKKPVCLNLAYPCPKNRSLLKHVFIICGFPTRIINRRGA